MAINLAKEFDLALHPRVMLEKLFPREKDFFPLFGRISDCLSDVMVELLEVVDNKKGLSLSLVNIRELESRAQRIIRESTHELHYTFITPFDRSHIFKFFILHGQIISTARLLIEKISHYPSKSLPLESIEIVIKCGQACTTIRKMIDQIKKIKVPSETLKNCIRIYEIVAENNLLAFNASQKLFKTEDNLKTLIQIKEINHDLVSITKKFEEISFLVEEIVLEYA